MVNSEIAPQRKALVWSPAVAMAVMLGAITGPLLARYMVEISGYYDSDPTLSFITAGAIFVVFYLPAMLLVVTRAPDLRQLVVGTLIVLTAVALQWRLPGFVEDHLGTAIGLVAALALPVVAAVSVAVLYVRAP